jgi:hypothetical protein
MEVISRGGTTAQIDPLRFCRWLLAKCQDRGVRLHIPARALSLSRGENGALDGIRISQDGVESERKTRSLCETNWLTHVSTMHTSGNHIWGMVVARLQHPLPQSNHTNTHFRTRWPLTSRP